MHTTSNPTKPILRLVALAVGMLALVGLATACQPPGCQQDCVTSVSVNPGATQTRLVFTVKAKVSLTIYSDSARTTPVVAKSIGVPLMAHTVHHSALKPHQTYWYTATATDEAGKAFKELGSFKTQRRTVTVRITRIKLIDDSDSVGTGELRFGLRAGSKDFSQVYADGDMASGTDQTGLQITKAIVDTAPSSMVFSVEGQDDDCEGIGSLCGGGTAFGYTSGSSDDMDWATASTVTLAMTPANGSGSWSASTTGYALKFEVSGTWSVAYAA